MRRTFKLRVISPQDTLPPIISNVADEDVTDIPSMGPLRVVIT
ncbi:MAG: hypothetical protein WCH39_04915 [Schlesneria sp.]